MRFCSLVSVALLQFVVVSDRTTLPDTKAESLLAVVQQSYIRTRSLSAEIELDETDSHGRTTQRKGRILLQKPNFARIRFVGDNVVAQNSDGKTIRTKGRAALPADPEGQNIEFSIPVSLFFGQPVFKRFPYNTAQPQYAGTERFAGGPYDVVDLRMPKPIYETVRLYIGSDRLIHRQVVLTSVPRGIHTIADQRLTHIKLNAYIPVTAFALRNPGSQGFPQQSGRLLPGLPQPRSHSKKP